MLITKTEPLELKQKYGSLEDDYVLGRHRSETNRFIDILAEVSPDLNNNRANIFWVNCHYYKDGTLSYISLIARDKTYYCFYVYPENELDVIVLTSLVTENVTG